MDVERLLKKLEEQEMVLRDRVNLLHKRGEALRRAGASVEESWSGSCFGYHNGLYYRHFQRPDFRNRFNVEWGCLQGVPPEWRDRTPDEVKAEIERRSGETFETLEKSEAELAQLVKTLRDEITMEISPVHSFAGFEREKRMLAELEKLEWDDTAQKQHVVNRINSCPRMTRDFEAINEGRRIPSHTYYEGVALGAEAHCDLTHKFWADAKKLLKQLQASGATAKGKLDPEQYQVREEKVIEGQTPVVSYVFSGSNARVHIASADHYVNVIVNAQNVFSGLKQQLESRVDNDEVRGTLLLKLEALEKAQGTKKFTERYQDFIASAADHITIIAPFIPALTQLLTGKTL